MAALRAEQEEAQAKVEELTTKVKTLEQENLAKEQEITSLSHRNQLLEAEVEKLETGIKDAKVIADEGAHHGTQNETLQRRLQLLEDEAEEADKSIRETNEKSVLQCPTCGDPAKCWEYYRLRQTDIKAGHFERKVQALENDRDQWETKYEEMAEKYKTAEGELEAFRQEIGSL